MSKLYPLRFTPIEKERVWGAESWVLSGLDADASVVSNGFLEGNNINELLEVYLTDLLGVKAFEKTGPEFPILIKYLTVNEFLSVQVHPDDETAAHMHNAYGKTEMWYVMEASPSARLYLGFNKDITAEEFYARCQNETLPEVMNCVQPKKGECYFIPSGLIHACGGGLTIAEVQQVSDITYRIYDWGREHNPATAREMHLDLAMACINFKKHTPAPTTTGKLVECPYFTTTYLPITKPTDCENVTSEAFVIYMGLQGQVDIQYQGIDYPLGARECVFIPECLNEWKLIPRSKDATLLEVRL